MDQLDATIDSMVDVAQVRSLPVYNVNNVNNDNFPRFLSLRVCYWPIYSHLLSTRQNYGNRHSHWYLMIILWQSDHKGSCITRFSSLLLFKIVCCFTRMNDWT